MTSGDCAHGSRCARLLPGNGRDRANLDSGTVPGRAAEADLPPLPRRHVRSCAAPMLDFLATPLGFVATPRRSCGRGAISRGRRRGEVDPNSGSGRASAMEATVAGDLEKLKDWIGQKESGVDDVTVPLVERLAATLDLAEAPREGEPLPRGWHSVLFPRVVRQSQIGPDGHPERGDFLPPVPLPRRMFAGRRVSFHGDLRVGDRARKESEIVNVTIKEGRSGKMVFVTARHSIHGPNALALVEEQDIVYRD